MTLRFCVTLNNFSWVRRHGLTVFDWVSSYELNVVSTICFATPEAKALQDVSEATHDKARLMLWFKGMITPIQVAQ